MTLFFLKLCAVQLLSIMKRTAAFDPYGGMLLPPKLESDQDDLDSLVLLPPKLEPDQAGLDSVTGTEDVAYSEPSPLEPDHAGLGSVADAEDVAETPQLEPDLQAGGLGSVANAETVADSTPTLEQLLDSSGLLLIKAESEYQDSYDRHATVPAVLTLTDDSDDAADAAASTGPAAETVDDADTDTDAPAHDDWLANVPWRRKTPAAAAAAGSSSNASTGPAAGSLATQERRNRSNAKKREDASYRNVLTIKRRERQHRKEGRDLHGAFGDSTTVIPDCFTARHPLPMPPKAPPPLPQKKSRLSMGSPMGPVPPPPPPPQKKSRPPRPLMMQPKPMEPGGQPPSLMPTQPAYAPPLHLIVPPPPPPVPARPPRPRPPLHPPPLQQTMKYHGSVARIIPKVPEPLNGPKHTCAASSSSMSSSSSAHAVRPVVTPKMSMDMMISTLSTMNFLVNAVNDGPDDESTFK